MATDQLVAQLIDKVIQILMNLTVQQFNYLFNYKNNIYKLSYEVKNLTTMKETVQYDVNAAKLRLEYHGAESEPWMRKVDEIREKAGDILNSTNRVVQGCYNGWCPNAKERYWLSKKATELTAEICWLQNDGKRFLKTTHMSIPATMLRAPSTASCDSTISRINTLEEVFRTLQDPQFSIIGLCGMPGVGKTMLLKEILTKVLATGLFDEVAMIEVSQHINLSKIQGEPAEKEIVENENLLKIQGVLAEMLKLKFEETDILARQRKLHARLTGDSKVLVILDQVWYPHSLGRVGLPGKDDQKGCKVLVASRDGQVCMQMGAQKNVTVHTLMHDEALELFKKTAGNCVETDELRVVADKIVRQCGGLPIAIEILARALTNKPIHAWKNALKQLKNSTAAGSQELKDKVFEAIQLSYGHLRASHPQAQPLLMLCCLFTGDSNVPVEKLIRYAKGLKLFDDLNNLEDTSDAVYSLLDELRGCFLLEDGDTDKSVKVHNLVHHACLLAASEGKRSTKDKTTLLLKPDVELEEWPNKDGDKIYTANSLESNLMQEIPSKLLRLQVIVDSVRMPRNLFRGMKGVRVFDFTAMLRWGQVVRINYLPSADKLLLNMRTLFLEFLKLDDVSMIGNLKNLEIVSFYGSRLAELPSEIRELGNLRLLDLRCSNHDRHPTIIPSGVLLSLKKLEDLYLGNYDSWLLVDGKEQNGRSNGVGIKELRSLSNLRTLQIRVKFPELLLDMKDFEFENLNRFQVSAIRDWLTFQEYEIGKSVTLDGADLTSVQDARFFSLLRSAESLTLYNTSLKNVFEVCSNLKTLKMDWCLDVDFIISKSDSPSAVKNLKHLEIRSLETLKEVCQVNFPLESLVKLETVKLDCLYEMTHLWVGPIQNPSLVHLRVIEMSDCGAVRSIFPSSMAKYLGNLQRLDISRCDMLEAIVGDVGEALCTDKIEFQKLSFLSLDDLQSFKSFFPALGTQGNSNNIAGEKHAALYKSWMAKLRRPASDSEQGAPANFKDEFERAMPLFTQLVKLPSLGKLLIRSMNNLKHIVDGQTHSESVSKLRVMHVDRCNGLLSLAASDSIKLLQNVEQIKVQNCKSMESVFDFDGINVGSQNVDTTLGKLEAVSLHKLKNLKHIWKAVPDQIQGLRGLRSLEISGCSSLNYVVLHSTAKMLVNLQELQLDKLEGLTSFCVGGRDLELPKLQHLVVKQCPRMEIFCMGNVVAPRLKRVKVGDNDDQWMWMGNVNETVSFLNQRRNL